MEEEQERSDTITVGREGGCHGAMAREGQVGEEATAPSVSHSGDPSGTSLHDSQRERKKTLLRYLRLLSSSGSGEN